MTNNMQNNQTSGESAVHQNSESLAKSFDKNSNKIEKINEVFVDINPTQETDDVPEVWEELTDNETVDKPLKNSIERPISKNTSEETITADKTSSSPTLCFGYGFTQFKWFNIFWLILIHSLAIYAYIYALLTPCKLLTVIWTVILGCGSGFGVSAGAHRLWAHRSYKAHFLLRLLLVILETMTINGSCYSYARDHRNHHKFVDSDADPKNAKRGFFFAHIGWWTVKKNSLVIQYGNKLSHKDLLDDWLVVWQHKLYVPLVIIWAIIFPMLVPVYIWNDSWLAAFNLCVVLRVVVALHHLFTVNSIAHIIGTRPYDKNIGPTESKITMYLSMGEGSHNYHHSFPMDYANCEKKWWEVFNPSTLFIDVCEKLGLAYDLKKPSAQVVQGTIQRKGDPEYFERKMKNSLCKRILLGFTDWTFGLLVALWWVWLAMAFKLITGRHTFVFDKEDLFWNSF